MAPASKTKKCTTCAKAIPVEASYCAECEAYQDWRRHLQFFIHAVPMLVAFGVILGSLFTTVGQWIVHHDSKLVTSALRPVSGAVELTVANLGDRPGVVDQVTFYLARLDNIEDRLGRWERPLVIRFTSSENPVIEASDVRKVRFLLTPGQEAAISTDVVLRTYGPTLNEAVCGLVFTGTEFTGSETTVEREASCLQTWLAIFPDTAGDLREGIDEALSRWNRELDEPAPNTQESMAGNGE